MKRPHVKQRRRCGEEGGKWGVEGLHEERVADLLVACVACGGLPKGRLSTTGRGWLLPEGLSSPLAVTSTHNGGAEAEAEAAGAAAKQDQRHLYRVGRACQEGEEEEEEEEENKKED